MLFLILGYLQNLKTVLVLFLDDGDGVGHGRRQHQRGGESQATQPERGQGNVSKPIIFILKVSAVSEGHIACQEQIV